MNKVLINASMYSSAPAGVGVYIREIWNRLPQDKSIEYECYTYSNKDLKNKKNIFIITIGFLKKFLSLHRLIWNIFYLPFIAKKYKLVYSLSSHGSPFIKNQIITIHDLICFHFPEQHRFQFFYFKYIMPFIIKACSKIVAISEFTKSEIIKYYKIDPAKIVVIYNGGNHLKPAENIADSMIKIPENFFLLVGAAYPHKNAERVFEAMKYVPDYALVVVSSVSDYYKKLKENVLAKDIKNIFFFEYISANELKEFYKKCTANVYVSLNEGFGFPPFEAAMQNKVSIISNTGALPEIYNGSMLQVNPLHVEEIGAALQKTANGFDESYYTKNFSALIEKYTWQKTVNKISNLIYNEAGCSNTI